MYVKYDIIQNIEMYKYVTFYHLFSSNHHTASAVDKTTLREARIAYFVANNVKDYVT